MKAFNIYLISDQVNGLLEVHFDGEVAEQALSNFIVDGQAINDENPDEEGRVADASNFFFMEEFVVESMDDLKAFWHEKGGASGVYSLDPMLEAEERGYISAEERLEAQE